MFVIECSDRPMNEKSPPGEIRLTYLDVPAILSPVDIGRIDRSRLPQLLHEASQDPDQANMFMRLSFLFYSLGSFDLGAEMQARALARRSVYRYVCARSPRIRLLAIMGRDGGLDNAPIEYLLENSDVRLDLLFLDEDGGVPDIVPDHDVAIIALGESCKGAVRLEKLADVVASWPRPVINHPQQVLNCGRDRLHLLLKDAPGLLVPQTRRIPREKLSSVGFPVIIRPLDTHGGKGMQKIDNADMLAAVLQANDDAEFFVADYIDYRSPDGAFRKIRIALIDGAAYVCHLAISDDWMVHYIPAGMDMRPSKRAEEQQFMEGFEFDFAKRHQATLLKIHETLKLDYVVLDCGELQDGRLLLFEADSRAWIHAVDPVDLFPYKPSKMQKAFDAFTQMLATRMSQ